MTEIKQMVSAEKHCKILEWLFSLGNKICQDIESRCSSHSHHMLTIKQRRTPSRDIQQRDGSPILNVFLLFLFFARHVTVPTNEIYGRHLTMSGSTFKKGAATQNKIKKDKIFTRFLYFLWHTRYMASQMKLEMSNR